MEGWRMTDWSKSAIVISVSVVYFYITSVHPWGNLTSREWSVSPFPPAKRLRLYQRGHDEFSADTHYVQALSEHAFKWTLSSSASYYTSVSKLSLLSSTTSNTITTAVLACLHPSSSLFFFFFFFTFSLSHFLLRHFSFQVHITKDFFHLLFMMDSSTFFKALYATSKFVAALNQTTKSHKPSFLTTSFLLSSFLLAGF